MSDYEIRAADRSDAALLVALERDAFGEQSWGAAGVYGGFDAPGVNILLCARPGAPPGASPAGFAIWRAAADEAELLSIGVAPDERRRGAGGALLDAVIAAAARAGAGAVYLDVDPANAAALALYARAGFAETARRKAYYRSGADAVLMIKRL